MAELLVPLRSKVIRSDRTNESHIVVVDQQPTQAPRRKVESTEYAIEQLRSQPQQETLYDVLKWLQPSKETISGFDINRQSSQASHIFHILVNDVLPDHWRNINGSTTNKARKTRDLIMSVLCNVGGISALATRLRILIQPKDISESESHVRQHGQAESLEDLLSLLGYVLGQDDCVLHLWSNLAASESNSTRRWLLWKELVALLGSGRILSLASEADDIVLKASSSTIDLEGRDAETQKAWVQLLERSLTLGHVDSIFGPILGRVIGKPTQVLESFRSYIMPMKGSSKKSVVNSLLRILMQTRISTAVRGENSDKKVSGVAALLYSLSRTDEDLAGDLLQWLSGDGLVQDLSIRRAVVAALAEDFEKLKVALSESLQSFGDKLFIKHTPILQQEGLKPLGMRRTPANANNSGTTENLLLLVGYAHRANHQHIADMTRSSIYLNAISNRLAASSSRASMLGMCVGTAVSKLVDPPDRQMNFSSEDVTGPQGQRFLRLTSLQDPLGSIDNLRLAEGTSSNATSQVKGNGPLQKHDTPRNVNQASTKTKIISIEEIESDSESEDDNLPAYAKPDSDASDSDEDPTVVNRDKPVAPVYINDLISGLQDTENYDRQTLAFTQASSLIRRKAAFGTEVLDSTEELASILTGLQDKWNFENFNELRLQAMIAVLVAQPLEMGQWFSRTYFSGDYSVSQRATVLTTLGLGARELAGYDGAGTALTKHNQPPRAQNNQFPSKRLPPNLHALYTPEEPLMTASKQLENSILKPMTLKAADALSGPNVLKTRTFSSRMDVEKKRTKAIPNALAKVVADGFFFPLTGRFQAHIRTSGGNNSTLMSPILLPPYLRTLALILHAAGSSTLSLPLMTTEFLSLLLALRPRTSHLPILDGLLFAFLTVLEVNGDREGMRRLAQENGKELLEMGQWVGGVFERIRGDGEEEGRVRALAAGCVARVREVVEAEERTLMGVGAGLL
ncbi:MAG: hypothetical protein Q9218_005233 [Villophora microphyllina]